VKGITKFLVIVAFAAPLLLAQKKKAAAADDNSTPISTSSSGPSATSASDPRQGEALETPNQRRRRLGPKASPKAATSTAVSTPVGPMLPTTTPNNSSFADAIDALETIPPKPSTKRLNWSTPAQTGIKKVDPPRDYQPTSTVAPSQTATDAVKISDHWKDTPDLLAEGKDGRVVFADGAGLPTIVCAPLRLCIIELQTGEKLTGEPQIGDSVRWNIQPASYGSGESTTPMIVIKPKALGLDTNLVITTDRRVYYLRLISNAQEYVAKVAFDYPDDNITKWVPPAKNPTAAQDGIPIVGSLEALNQNYRVSGDELIRPIMVLDDGTHTYIRMNGAILHREAPVLAVIGPDGKAEMVNYRVQGSVYIVDRLFDRARLILGSGRKALKADIIRGSAKDRKLFARDPFRALPSVDQEGAKAQ
jgi:P-type conjugative transfer protein TrbG